MLEITIPGSKTYCLVWMSSQSLPRITESSNESGLIVGGILNLILKVCSKNRFATVRKDSPTRINPNEMLFVKPVLELSGID
jgi:hypothetical protein